MAFSSNVDSGFITPVFGVLAIALALIATAGAQLARTEEIASRRQWERTQELYLAEGVATVAAWRVLHERDAPTLEWREPAGSRIMQVRAEPEFRKLSLDEVDGPRGHARLDELLGSAEATHVRQAIVSARGFSGAGRISRIELVELSASPLWRACGLGAWCQRIRACPTMVRRHRANR